MRKGQGGGAVAAAGLMADTVAAAWRNEAVAPPGRRVARLGLLFLSMLLLGAAPPAKPRRIMSINLCNDLMLLMLVPRDRIASITFLAHDAVSVLMPGRDAGIALNHGAAEEIAQQKPDLILASPWTSPLVRRLAGQIDAPVVEIETASSFADIRRVTRHMGAAVGEPERAEALIRSMDRELAALQATRPARRMRVVAWNGGGGVPGRGTLTDAIITAAGADNIGAAYADARQSSFDLEELLSARPDAVMQGVSAYDAPSLHQGSARHPLLDRVFRGRHVDYPEAAYACGLPQSARAAGDLRRALATIPPRQDRW
jgi:iron complex transport system substrate-binding protein